MAKKRILVIQARNLGDAVVQTGLIEALGRSEPGVEISVLTRPQFREIYYSNPLISEIFYASFPMGTVKNFGFNAAMKLARTVAALRRKRFDRVVNVVGDFRENLLGWAISPSGNTSITWAHGHPQAKDARTGGEKFVAHLIMAPADDPSSYSSIQRVATALGATAPAHSRLYDASGKPYAHRSGSDSIGIQPTASEECKLWPQEHWRGLITMIRASGLRVVVFGAPSERSYLEGCLPDADDPGTEIVAGPLAEFFRSLEDVRVLIGLDSFGVHTARAIGTPAIMIYGANITTVWTPPGTIVVKNSKPPSCYPCFNKPSCTGRSNPYSCIRDIPLAAVTENLKDFGVVG